MQTSLMTMEMGETDREELDIRAELLHFKRTERWTQTDRKMDIELYNSI